MEKIHEEAQHFWLNGGNMIKDTDIVGYPFLLSDVVAKIEENKLFEDNKEFILKEYESILHLAKDIDESKIKAYFDASYGTSWDDIERSVEDFLSEYLLDHVMTELHGGEEAQNGS